MIKRFVSLLVVSFASSYSQQSQPTGAAAAPAARPASFATVTALTRAVLDSKSCVSGKEFRISITSSFVFSSEAIEDDAEFVGHIQACNHDDKGRLSKAVVLIDSLSLQKGKILPITAVLQALGPVPQPRFTEYGYLTWEKLEKSGAAPLGQSAILTEMDSADFGILTRTRTGVVGLKNVTFENKEAWGFTTLAVFF